MEWEQAPAGPAGEHLTFGDLLRGYRLSAGLSQEALSERSGLSVDAVAALERGRRRSPRAATVRLLCDGLRVSDADRELLVRAADRRTRPSPPAVPQTPHVPLATQVRDGLPDLADEFVGRTEERAEVVARLADPTVRLLTLTGFGGVGKTRLAVSAVRLFAQRSGVEVIWVPLGAVPVGTPVLRALQRAVGIREAIGNSPDAAMIRTLSGRPVLLLLDDCEHLLDDCTALVETLLPECPDLQVVATSREILRARAEHVYAVPPLPLPPAGCPVDELERYAAVRLFLTRAAALHRAPLTDRAALRTVARICRRLQGVPLAIELAAARSTVLSLDQINDGLNDALGVLAAGPRTALPRHQTLRATIQWSYDLLAEPERRLLQSMSVFAGGWCLEGSSMVHGSPTLGPLAQLVDKSLVTATTSGAEARFELLDTIRQYAAEQLAATGREEEVRRRHAAYHLDLASGTLSSTDDPEARTAAIDAEQANLRAALDWSLRNDPDLALRLTAATWRFWMVRGLYFEGRDWSERALRAGPGTTHPAYADVLLGAGTLAFFSCDYDVATRHVEAALTAYVDVGSDRGRAESLQRLGTIARERADYDAAVRLHTESLAVWRRLGDADGIANGLNFMSFVSWLRCDFDAAATYAEQAARHYRRTGGPHGMIWALMNAGCIARYREQYADATRHLRRTLRMCEDVDYPEGVAWAADQLGACARLDGDLPTAEPLLERALVVHRDLGDRWRSASVMEELAILDHMAGRPERAVYRFAVAADVRAEIGAPIPPVERPERAAHLAALKAELSPAVFEEQSSLGRESQWQSPVTAPPNLTPGQRVPAPRARARRVETQLDHGAGGPAHRGT